MISLKIFLLSSLLSLFITPLVIVLAQRKKILYYPTLSSVNRKPVPLLGGAAIVVSFSLALLIFFPQPGRLLGIFVAGLLVFLVGLVDDIKRGVSSYARFLIQVIAAAIIVSQGVSMSFIPNDWWGSQAIENVLSVIWIAGISNAYNMLDGLDGLASGSCVINSLCFLVISHISNQAGIAFVSAALGGACLGFLFHNFSPARIFLGSSGSTTMGFILAVISIKGNWAEDNLIALSVPFLILGIPIFDLIMTTIVRIRCGYIHSIKEWFDYRGRDHFHYALLNLGISIPHSVLFIYVLTVSIGLSATILFTSGSIDAVLLVVQAAFILTALFLFTSLTRARKTA